MVDVETNKNRIVMTQWEIEQSKSPKRRRDLFKYLMRLKKELRECEMHMNGTYGRKPGGDTCGK